MILYNDGFTVFFPHIPKTAGTALTRWFTSNRYGVYGNTQFDLMDMRKTTRESFVSVLKYNSHFHEAIYTELYNMREIDYLFAVVRNPINRLISDCFYHNRLGYNFKSLDQFIHHAVMARRYSSYGIKNHLRPQIDYVGKTIKRIFKFEDGIDNIAKQISEEIPYITELEVPVLNKTKQDYDPVKIWNDTSQKAKEFVHILYAEDFKTFGYDFHGGPDVRH